MAPNEGSQRIFLSSNIRNAYLRHGLELFTSGIILFLCIRPAGLIIKGTVLCLIVIPQCNPPYPLSIRRRWLKTGIAMFVALLRAPADCLQCLLWDPGSLVKGTVIHFFPYHFPISLYFRQQVYCRATYHVRNNRLGWQPHNSTSKRILWNSN